MIKHFTYLTLALILTSCDPFQEGRVMSYNSELIEIVKHMQEYQNTTLNTESDERLTDNMRKLRIDIIIKNTNKQNTHYSGFIEENDSLLIFIKKTKSLFTPEKRILYDFAKNPRNYGNVSIENATYNAIQLNERWYFSTVEFD